MEKGTQLLEEYRKTSGKTKSFLAKRCGISRSTLFKCWKEPSEFSCRVIKILCEELGITSADMMKIFFTFEVA